MVPRKGSRPSDLWHIYEVKCHSDHPEVKDEACNRAIFRENSSSKNEGPGAAPFNVRPSSEWDESARGCKVREH